MEIIFNGKKTLCPDGLTLAAWLADRRVDARVNIVERNGEVCRDAVLADGDEINLYRVVAGG
ncbi:MAG: MoaD/ThiS family protein [Planctomycetota bacterium]|jgi:sulfur carrier protein ThiS|nr:MoaD/ThiS family protein [Planctomycetota bacterium]